MGKESIRAGIFSIPLRRLFHGKRFSSPFSLRVYGPVLVFTCCIVLTLLFFVHRRNTHRRATGPVGKEILIADFACTGEDLAVQSSRVPESLFEAVIDAKRKGTFPAHIEAARLPESFSDRPEARDCLEKYGASCIVWGTMQRDSTGTMQLREEILVSGPVWTLMQQIDESLETTVNGFLVGVADPLSFPLFYEGKPDRGTTLSMLEIIYLYRKGMYRECMSKLHDICTDNSCGEELRILQANVHLHTGRFDRARELYEEIVSARSGSMCARKNLLLCCAQMGIMEKCNRDLVNMKDEAVEDPVLLNTFGYISILEGDYQSAYDLVKKSAKCDSEWRNAAGESNIAVILTLAGNYREALRILNRRLTEEGESARLLYMKAGILTLLDRAPEAVDVYDRILDVEPDHWKSWYHRGCLLFQRGETQRALQSLHRGLEVNPRIVELWLEKARILIHQKKYVAASIALDNALEIDEDYQPAWMEKARLSLLMCKFQNALEYYRRIIRFDPDNLQAWMGMTEGLMELGDYNGAMRSIEKVLSLDRSHFRALHLRGRILLSMKDYSNAIESLNKACELNPHDVSATLERGIAYLKKGECERALDDFDMVLSVNPEDEKALSNRGLALMLCGEFEESVRLYEKLLGEDPGDVDILLGMGYSLFQLDEKEEAFDYFNKARSIDPEAEHIIRQMLLN
jgi:tetratricopeptide (TPR) repeat protein